MIPFLAFFPLLFMSSLVNRTFRNPFSYYVFLYLCFSFSLSYILLIQFLALIFSLLVTLFLVPFNWYDSFSVYVSLPFSLFLLSSILLSLLSLLLI